MIGSCFSVEMAQRMALSKFDVLSNPFGILFNPFSVFNALSRICNKRYYSEDDLVFHSDKWHSLDHHGDFSHAEKDLVLEQINSEINRAHDHLKACSVLFITSGTAWVYHHLERNQTAGNCHKMPNKEFEKRLLHYQDVHLILRHVPQLLERFNPDLKIVFTVSPVRHWKDGAIQNQRSKSLLNAGSHAVVDEFSNCHYFPAYELVMDDLRDYRFYATDMLHLSDQATDYIWDKFSAHFFTDATQEVIKDVKNVKQAMAHRPVDPESNSFQRFVKRQLADVDELQAKYTQLDFSPEREHFERYLL